MTDCPDEALQVLRDMASQHKGKIAKTLKNRYLAVTDRELFASLLERELHALEIAIAALEPGTPLVNPSALFRTREKKVS